MSGKIASIAVACSTVSVQSVDNPAAESFYWATITFSQTLGTALGDWMADDTGLGYLGGALVFGAALALIAALYFRTRISRVVLFWASPWRSARLESAFKACNRAAMAAASVTNRSAAWPVSS